LFGRYNQINKLLSSYHEALSRLITYDSHGTESVDNAKLSPVIGEFADLEKIAYRQAILFSDLKIYLQKKVLSGITGYKIPDRELPDEGTPRLILGKKGMLEVVEGQSLSTRVDKE
jgi:hypothetical protein